jgi:hypothetical protein
LGNEFGLAVDERAGDSGNSEPEKVNRGNLRDEDMGLQQGINYKSRDHEIQ